MTSDQGRDQWPPDDGQKRPGPSAAVTAALGLTADAAIDGRWWDVAGCAFGTLGLAWRATHPPEWWEDLGHRVADRMGL